MRICFDLSSEWYQRYIWLISAFSYGGLTNKLHQRYKKINISSSSVICHTYVQIYDKTFHICRLIRSTISLIDCSQLRLRQARHLSRRLRSDRQTAGDEGIRCLPRARKADVAAFATTGAAAMLELRHRKTMNNRLLSQNNNHNRVCN